MPTINRFAELHPEITKWRRDFHENPELMFDVHRTARIVAQKLEEFGCDVIETGVGRTGVVAVIKGKTQNSGRVMGLRADMDALPMHEATGKEYASKTPGKMHACGHDGHTSMLLGAAQYLAETRNFDGTAVMIFQPAEEGGGGGKEMVDDGFLDKYGVQDVYGMHNFPGLPEGHFTITPGPMMAAADTFTIDVEGTGGHAAKPHQCIDTTVVAYHIVIACQSIVSRNTDPLDELVVSICSFMTESDAHNVIPQHVRIKGTVRTLSPEVQDMAEERIKLLVENTAKAYGATAKVDYNRGYPVTINTHENTNFAIQVAKSISGDGNVEENAPPLMGSEDFSFMLNERPGAYIGIGNGPGAYVHHPEYDFNDDIIPAGCSYWAKLVETGMPTS